MRAAGPSHQTGAARAACRGWQNCGSGPTEPRAGAGSAAGLGCPRRVPGMLRGPRASAGRLACGPTVARTDNCCRHTGCSCPHGQQFLRRPPPRGAGSRPEPPRQGLLEPRVRGWQNCGSGPTEPRPGAGSAAGRGCASREPGLPHAPRASAGRLTCGPAVARTDNCCRHTGCRCPLGQQFLRRRRDGRPGSGGGDTPGGTDGRVETGGGRCRRGRATWRRAPGAGGGWR